MNRIDMLAGEVHFVDHLAAVWNALPEEARGSFVLRHWPGADRPALVARARSHGIEPGHVLAPDGPAVLAAAVGDLNHAHRLGRRRLALMEHGAGQAYGGRDDTASRNPSYAGGYGRPAGLFLHPNEQAAARDRASYRRARVEVVGAPFLDLMPARDPDLGRAPVIAAAFHFEASVAPEARPAFGHYRNALAELATRHVVIGHGHPRIIDRLAVWYDAHGIEVVRDFRDVLRRADLLLFDNTSAGFAFAASGRPVVVLDAPTYRRDVSHGLRFWDAVGGPDGTGPARLGIRIGRPDELAGAVERALVDDAETAAARELALAIAYTHRTGAAPRAAGVLVDWLADRAAAA